MASERVGGIQRKDGDIGGNTRTQPAENCLEDRLIPDIHPAIRARDANAEAARRII